MQSRHKLNMDAQDVQDLELTLAKPAKGCADQFVVKQRLKCTGKKRNIVYHL